MIVWRLGTIGFTYPEWKGSFYPTGLPANQSLSFYSKVFNTVEINTTFYGPQSPAQIQRWVDSTPDDFCFCMKTPKRITHELRLQTSAPQEMKAFVDASLGLGSKFGPILVQLPPSYKADNLAQLSEFLKSLPAGPQYSAVRYVFEFRHASWHQPDTAQKLVKILREHGAGWVSLDYEDLPVEIYSTAPFLYIRWIGKHGVLPHPGQEVIDRTARLQEWITFIESSAAGGMSTYLETIFGFFDNDYAGHSPATCNRFKSLIGLPVNTSQAGEQGRLF